MGALWRRLAERLHLIVTLLSAWLILTSPWVALLRRMPRDAGLLERAHLWLGFATLALGFAYLADCVRGGAWRQNFPWLPGQVGVVAADLRGLLRGRLPAAEGGGLIGAIAGLTLLALLATGATGAAWYWTQGTEAALAWRAHHLLAANTLIVFIVLHVVAVGLHLLDFVGD